MVKSENQISVSHKIPRLHLALLPWYRQSKRDLPWRKTKDPYLIWVSEVMLQQTRVETVIEYYHRFTKKFPTVDSLAMASEHDVLREWQGLGYYRRAKLIHSAAKTVSEKYNGQLPSTRNELAELPGFGPYTSGAVASIAFNEPVPAVDGNVKRVLSRIFATNQGIEDIALQAAINDAPSDWTQALMELGALICVPKNPKCLICPVNKECIAFQTQAVDQFPIKTKKTNVKKLFSTISIMENKDKFLIQQRGSEGRYANMWEFPTNEAEAKQSVDPKKTIGSFVHQLTHRIIYIDVIVDSKKTSPIKNQKWVTEKELSDFALSRMQKKAFEIWKQRMDKSCNDQKTK